MVIQEMNCISKVKSSGNRSVVTTSNFFVIYQLHWDDKQIHLTARERKLLKEHEIVTQMKTAFVNEKDPTISLATQKELIKLGPKLLGPEIGSLIKFLNPYLTNEIN